MNNLIDKYFVKKCTKVQIINNFVNIALWYALFSFLISGGLTYLAWIFKQDIMNFLYKEELHYLVFLLIFLLVFILLWSSFTFFLKGFYKEDFHVPYISTKKIGNELENTFKLPNINVIEESNRVDGKGFSASYSLDLFRRGEDNLKLEVYDSDATYIVIPKKINYLSPIFLFLLFHEVGHIKQIIDYSRFRKILKDNFNLFYNVEVKSFCFLFFGILLLIAQKHISIPFIYLYLYMVLIVSHLIFSAIPDILCEIDASLRVKKEYFNYIEENFFLKIRSFKLRHLYYFLIQSIGYSSYIGFYLLILLVGVLNF